jgi:hypothetical protein
MHMLMKAWFAIFFRNTSDKTEKVTDNAVDAGDDVTDLLNDCNHAENSEAGRTERSTCADLFLMHII